MSEPLTPESFEEWRHHPITQRLMKMLLADRESMKEGLLNNAFEDEQEVKGRCRAIALIINLDYQDLYTN
jgi:hypothetical protein